MISYDEAVKRLEIMLQNPSNITLSELENLVNELSIVDNTAPQEAVTHLYTKMNNDKSFISNDVRALDHTDAFKFIDSASNPDYEVAVRIAFERQYPNLESVEELLSDYLYGGQTNGTTGPWAEISRRFAADTKGNVVCHIGDINEAATRTWWNVEIPTILGTTGVTSINGVSIEDFKYIYNNSNSTNALDNVCRLINDVLTNNTDVNFINRAIIAYGDDGNILKVDVTGTGTGDLPEGCTALGYAGSVDSNIKHNL